MRDQTVEAYWYYKTSNNNKNAKKKIEYFIPSLQFCFNQENVFESNKAHHVENHNDQPLNLLHLPKDLVDKIEAVLRRKENHDVYVLSNDTTFQALFNKAHPEVLVKSSYTFWDKHKIKGHHFLKKALVAYILKNELPPHVKIDKFIEVINGLNHDEQHSLYESIKSTLRMDDDGKLSELRNQAINEINETHQMGQIVKTGAVTGMLFNLFSDDISLRYPESAKKFTAGFILGCAWYYFDAYYQKYSTRQYWNEVEKRLHTIMDQIEDNDLNMNRIIYF